MAEAQLRIRIKKFNDDSKTRRGCTMVKGCFAASNVDTLVFIDGTMFAEIYVNILRNNLRQCTQKLNIL